MEEEKKPGGGDAQLDASDKDKDDKENDINERKGEETERKNDESGKQEDTNNSTGATEIDAASERKGIDLEDEAKKPKSARSRPPTSSGKPSEKEDVPKAKTPAPNDEDPKSGEDNDNKDRTTIRGNSPIEVPDPAGITRSDSVLLTPRTNQGEETPRSIVSPPLTSRTLDRSQGGFCDICPQLGGSNTTNAEFVCDFCQQRFCLRCAKRHLETPVFAKHDVAPMTVLQEDDMISLQDLKCRVHCQRTLEYYCQGCQEAACGMCISFNHGGNQHQIGKVDKLDQNRLILLTRYEKLMQGEQPATNKTASSPASHLPPVLLWKKESFQEDTEKPEKKKERLSGPCDLTFLSGGEVVVADRWNQSVKVFDKDGNNPRSVLEKLAPLRVCTTPSGRVAVVDDFGQGQIRILHSEQLAKDIKDLSDPEDAMSSSTKQDTLNESKREDTSNTPDNKSTVGVDGNEHSNGEDGSKSAERTGENEDSEQSKDNDNENERMADVGYKPENQQNTIPSKPGTRQGGRRTAMGSKPGTRQSGRRSVDTSIFRDLSMLINSEDDIRVHKSWKPQEMSRPWAIAINHIGQWLVSEYEQYVKSTVTIYDSNGKRIKSFGGLGDQDDKFEWPAYLSSDSRGRIIISDYYNHAVKIFDHRGNFVNKIGKGWGKKDGHLTFPKGVCVDSDDHILVVDSGNARVCEFAPDGSFLRNVLTTDDGLVDPEGIAFVEVPDKESEEPESANQKPEQKDSQPANQSVNTKQERRIAVTLCKGHEYSALLVYSLGKTGQ